MRQINVLLWRRWWLWRLRAKNIENAPGDERDEGDEDIKFRYIRQNIGQSIGIF